MSANSADAISPQMSLLWNGCDRRGCGVKGGGSFLTKKGVSGIMCMTAEDIRKIRAACSTEEDRLLISELARTGMTVRELKTVKGGPILFPWL